MIIAIFIKLNFNTNLLIFKKIILLIYYIFVNVELNTSMVFKTYFLLKFPNTLSKFHIL
jgi:hypothetical protein